jgi:hypothetical protein
MSIDDDLRAIRTFPELIDYLVMVARDRNWDEVEIVEGFVSAKREGAE